MARPDYPAIHYTKLGPARPDSELATEIEVFRRELPRLLAEGHEGKYVLIKGGEVIGLWDDKTVAYREAIRRFPRQPFALQLVAEWQPLIARAGHQRWVA
jgi:hypothetical protein